MIYNQYCTISICNKYNSYIFYFVKMIEGQSSGILQNSFPALNNNLELVNNDIGETDSSITDNLDMANYQGSWQNNNFPNNGGFMPNDGRQYGQGPQSNGYMPSSEQQINQKIVNGFGPFFFNALDPNIAKTNVPVKL